MRPLPGIVARGFEVLDATTIADNFDPRHEVVREVVRPDGGGVVDGDDVAVYRIPVPVIEGLTTRRAVVFVRELLRPSSKRFSTVVDGGQSRYLELQLRLLPSGAA